MLFVGLGDLNVFMFVIGGLVIVFLFWVCKGLKLVLLLFGVVFKLVDVIIKVGFVMVVVVMILVVWVFGLLNVGVKIVGIVF